MQRTPSGVDYVEIPGRYLKGTAGGMVGILLHGLPAQTPLVVVCPHDLHTEVKLRMAFDVVEVGDGWIKAYTDRGSFGVNEDHRFVVRADKSLEAKPEFIHMDGRQTLIIFKVESAQLKPEHREEFQAIAGAYRPSS